MSYTILSNKAQCKHCNDIIESTYTHDYVRCKCRKIAVDGGKDYLKRCGEREDVIELSEIEVKGITMTFVQYRAAVQDYKEETEDLVELDELDELEEVDELEVLEENITRDKSTIFCDDPACFGLHSTCLPICNTCMCALRCEANKIK